MSHHDPVLFREVQRFGQLWLLLLLAGLGIVIPASILVAIHLEKGEVSRGDMVGILLTTVFTLLIIGLVFFVLHMTTEVRRSGLYLAYFPFRRLREIPLEGMTRQRAVEYRPIRDYGGYGIKGSKGKRAYNVSGNRGVRIDFEDDRHILIGSQEPERLSRAIDKMLRRRG
jgi:hypothetical protein